MEMLTEVFCDVDDFCKSFEADFHKTLLSNGLKTPRRCKMSLSEMMTIMIHFHQSGYRCFKHFYLQHVQTTLVEAFPIQLSYTRFVELIPSSIIALSVYMKSRLAKPSGIAYVDSTSLKVCLNQRIYRHKTFKQSAARGKTSMGWFYGFKLHLIVSERGEILAVKCTPGNTSDVTVLEELCENLFGKLFGDRGYISKKASENLKDKFGIDLMTTVRKNMKPKQISKFDKVLLRGRSIIETINDQLKNIYQIEHTRHRAWTSFVANLIAGLVAYTFQEKKPALDIDYAGLVAV